MFWKKACTDCAGLDYLQQMLLWVAMVSRVSPSWVRITPRRFSSSSVRLQAMALARAVTDAVSSQGFKGIHLRDILCGRGIGGAVTPHPSRLRRATFPSRGRLWRRLGRGRWTI